MQHASAAAVPVGVRRPLRLVRLAGDERLVAFVREGDERAFELLYDRHHRSILGFCRHMLGSREEAEDAVQHTFLAAYRDLVGSDKAIELRPWLFAIARNRCLSLLRARREHAALELAQPSTDGLAATVERREDLRELLGDVAQLPEDQRAALLLSELAALDHAGIAAVLGCPREKVKALVFQARSSLIASREARATPCDQIRIELATASGGALRRGPLRRHLRACAGCRTFKAEIAGQRQLLALALPVVPAGAALKAGALGGIGGGAATSGGTGAGASICTTGGASLGAGTTSGIAGTGALGTIGTAAGAKVAMSLAVAVTVGGGALAIETRQRDAQLPASAPNAAAPAEAPPRAPSPAGGSVAASVARSVPASPPSSTPVTRSTPPSATRDVAAPSTGPHRGQPAPYTAPGHDAGRARGHGAAESTPPGQATTPPGQATTPPGHARTPPGHATTPPGHARTPPGHARTPPGQARTPPGEPPAGLPAQAQSRGASGAPPVGPAPRAAPPGHAGDDHARGPPSPPPGSGSPAPGSAAGRRAPGA